MSFESLGAQQMKNIAESIITYRVSLSAIAARPTRVAALPPNAVAKPPAGALATPKLAERDELGPVATRQRA